MDNFPIFTKIDPPEILMSYLESYIKDGIDPMVDPFNLSGTYPDVCGKRKKESREEGSSRPQKKKKDVAFLDEDEVPLNEREKTIVLQDMSYVVHQSSRASINPTPGKLPMSRIYLFIFDSANSERVLPTQPPPISQPISSMSQLIYEPIPLPPPIETFVYNLF